MYRSSRKLRERSYRSAQLDINQASIRQLLGAQRVFEGAEVSGGRVAVGSHGERRPELLAGTALRRTA